MNTAPRIDLEKPALVARLGELRRRLIVCCIAIAAASGICYVFSQQLFLLLARPVQAQMPKGGLMQYLGIAEAFLTYVRISLICGVALAMPVILCEIWKFAVPVTYGKRSRPTILFVLASMLFFVAGAGFCYFAVFGFAFRFLLGFSEGTLTARPGIQQVLSFSARMMLAFGLTFEMPIFFFFLGRAGLVSHQWLSRQRRYAIVLIFVGAAALTPGPDVFSQLLLAGPLLLLYETSVQVVRFTGRKRDGKS
jgi:sec-independent protein translocase protein TatC